MKIQRIKEIFDRSPFLFLLLIISLLLFLWSFVFCFYDNLHYAYFFFKEIYIIVLVTLFGFLLITSSTLINTASTAIYHSHLFAIEDAEEEKHENHRESVIAITADLCLYLFILFLFSVSLWIFTLQAIQEGSILKFHVFSSLCIIFMISLVAITVYQMYVTANLKEKSTESYKNKSRSGSVFTS